MSSYLIFTYHPFAWPMLFMGFFLFFFGIFSISRSAEYNKSGAGLIWAVALWVITYGAELSAFGLDAKLFWDKVQTIGTAAIPGFWFSFTCLYTNHKQWLTKKSISLISIIPIGIMISAFTNDYHGLYWDEINLVVIRGVPSLIQTYGPIGKFAYLFFISFSLAGIIILIRYYFTISGLKKKQTTLVLIGILIPVIAAVLDAIGYSEKFGVGFLPIGFFGTSFCIGLAFFFFGIGKKIIVSYEKVIEVMDQGVIVVDSSDKVLTVNPFAQKIFLFDYNKDFSPIQAFFPEWDNWQSEVQNNNTLIKLFQMEGRDYDLHIFKLSYEDEEVSTVVTFNDITNQKIYESELKMAKNKAEAANIAKSEFLANMSHELRTPLNHILGFTDLVLQEKVGPLNDVQSEYLNDAFSSGNHLLSLISDILDLSKIEAQKMHLQVDNIDLSKLIYEIISSLRVQTEEKNIGIKSEFNFNKKYSLDSRKMKQIFYNLLSNALKFTPSKGSVLIKGEEKNNSIVIYIKDSGIGINSINLERIFNPFEQIDNSMTRKYKGTGLGLNLTRRLVELHGGSISALSNGIEPGSTFIITIPVL